MAGLRNRTLVSRYGHGSFPDYLGNSTGWFGRKRQEKKDNTSPVGRVNFASFHFQKLAAFLPSIVSGVATTVMNSSASPCCFHDRLGSTCAQILQSRMLTQRHNECRQRSVHREIKRKRKLCHGTWKCHTTSLEIVWQYFTGNVFCISTGVG